MASDACASQSFSSHPPHVVEVQSSMCQSAQIPMSHPIARWILEEGQLLGVLVASFPAPLQGSPRTVLKSL